MAKVHNQVNKVLAITALVFATSLALYVVGKVLVINPFLCVFGLLACGLLGIVVRFDKYWYYERRK